tara:strand:+ start:208 stop:534 length:327 start_codon:yes stop_codon:yes gene_type:complete
MVIETILQIIRDCLIPASSWSHGFLSCLPPLLGFPGPKLMVNMEELRCHQSMPSAVRSSPFPAVALVSEASQYGFDLRTVEVAVCNESKRIERCPFLGFSTNQRQLAR